MLEEACILTETLATLFTVIRLFVAVKPSMLDKFCRSDEGLSTFPTRVRFLPSVDPPMHGKASYLSEGFPTFLTCVYFFFTCGMSILHFQISIRLTVSCVFGKLRHSSVMCVHLYVCTQYTHICSNAHMHACTCSYIFICI